MVRLLEEVAREGVYCLVEVSKVPQALRSQEGMLEASVEVLVVLGRQAQ